MSKNVLQLCPKSACKKHLHGYKDDRDMDPYAESAAAIISSIKDEKIRALLLGQLQAAKKWEC